MRKFTSNLGGVRQQMGEKMGRKDKTNYDNKFESQCAEFEKTKKMCDELEAKVKGVLPVVSSNMTKSEALGQTLNSNSTKFETSTFTTSLESIGAVQTEIGAEERTYNEKVTHYVIGAINEFRNEAYKNFKKENATLIKYRRDMDALKNKQRTGKGWTPEMDERLEKATSMHDEQNTKVQGILDSLPAEQETLRSQMRDFVKAQLTFHQNATAKLETTLKALPAEGDTAGKKENKGDESKVAKGDQSKAK